MARRVIGLDLGAYSVKIVRLEIGNQFPKFQIADTFEDELVISEDDEELFTRQEEALKRSQLAGLLDAEIYACGLESSFGHMRRMEVPFVDARKVDAILPGLLESELPFDLEDMIISWHKQEPINKEAKASEESSLIRIGFGRKEAIGAKLHLLQNFNVDPRLLHLSSAASYELIREIGFSSFMKEDASENSDFGAIVDFGHSSTNLCIFNQSGLVSTHTLFDGGKKLTEKLANELEISFAEAQEIKHHEMKLDLSHLEKNDINAHKVGTEQYRNIIEHIKRIFLASESLHGAAITKVAIIGGGAKASGLENLIMALLGNKRTLRDISEFFPAQVDVKSMGLAYGYATSLLHPHQKDNRFNFRKDEFVWRGELDFLRVKSVPLILWGLSVICAFTVMWFAQSLVLGKENNLIDKQITSSCKSILGQANLSGKKCLTLMKEQINSQVDLGIPEFVASDVYLKLVEALPKDVKVILTELDILEKRVRVAAESPTYEDIDKVTNNIRQVPCFIKIETGRTEKTEKGVKYNLSFDIDCNADAAAKVG